MDSNNENIPTHANIGGVYIPSEKEQERCRKIAADAILPNLFEPKKKRLSVQRSLPMVRPFTDTANEHLSIHERLQVGYSSKKGFGWRAKQCGFSSTTAANDKNFISLLLRDYDQLISFLSVNKVNVHNQRMKDGKFKERIATFNPSTVEYLAFAWGVSRGRIHYLKRKDRAGPATSTARAVNHTRLSVIDSIEAAAIKYTPRNEFINNFVRKKLDEHEMEAVSRARMSEFRRDAAQQFTRLSNEDLRKWEFHSRSKIERQPFIKQFILDEIKQNPEKTYAQLAASIDNWCGPSVIGRWLQKQGHVANIGKKKGKTE